MLYYIALGIAILAVLMFLVVRVKKGGVAGLFTKTFASLLFIIVAFAAYVEKPINSEWFIYVALGLIFGMVGDIVLDLKCIYLKDSDKYLLAGMGSFTVGHCFFLAGLITLYGAHYLPPIIAVILGTVAVLSGPMMKLDYGKFKIPAIIYGSTLAFTMCQSCYAMIIDNCSTKMIIMFIGAVFFMISDLVLSLMYFGKDKNTSTNVVINHATYYIAQLLIASTVFFI